MKRDRELHQELRPRIDLDAFISKAVSDVRKAKLPGKAGKDARKNLRESAEELERIKARRRALIIAIAEAQWKKTAYTLYCVDTICPCCSKADRHPCAVHLEERHGKTNALRSKEVPNFIPPTDYSLKRITRVWETKFQVCTDCFTRVGITEDSLAPVFRATKEVSPVWKALLPKTLLLTYQRE